MKIHDGMWLLLHPYRCQDSCRDSCTSGEIMITRQNEWITFLACDHACGVAVGIKVNLEQTTNIEKSALKLPQNYVQWMNHIPYMFESQSSTLSYTKQGNMINNIMCTCTRDNSLPSLTNDTSSLWLSGKLWQTNRTRQQSFSDGLAPWSRTHPLLAALRSLFALSVEVCVHKVQMLQFLSGELSNVSFHVPIHLLMGTIALVLDSSSLLQLLKVCT